MIVVEDEARILDPQKAGLKHIGRGNEYDVYNGITAADGSNQVVKVPRHRWYHGVFKPTPMREQAEDDFKTVNNFFIHENDPIFAQTDFWGTDGHYRVLQEALQKPRSIRRCDLKNPKIRAQVKKALQINGDMYDQLGKSLGIIGRDGALSLLTFRPQITNMLIEQKGDKQAVRGIDFGLLRRNIRLEHAAIIGNDIVLRTFFGLSIKGKEIRSPFAPRIRAKK